MRRGQYPNPTFLNKAEGIKKERHTKTIIAVAIVVFVALTALFIRIGANMQRLYEDQYPDLVGAATAATTTIVIERPEYTSSFQTNHPGHLQGWP